MEAATPCFTAQPFQCWRRGGTPSQSLPKYSLCFRFDRFTVASVVGSADFQVSSAGKVPVVEQPGGRMVVELIGAFNDLTEKFPSLSKVSSSLLFKTLKRAIPILLALPLAPDGRPPLSRALSVACILADLQMDAEVISATILQELLGSCLIKMEDVKSEIGTSVSHLLHECLRVRHFASRIENIDDHPTTLAKFCLTYYDTRAVILELASRLDMMRHLDHLPKYRQHMLALQIIKIYSPLAHALGISALSLELEDLSFQCLLPRSYAYLNSWLRTDDTGCRPLIDVCKEQLIQSLQDDPVLKILVDDVSISGRFKSRFSTMKKLLKDGRKPEQVNDLLGLHVVLRPTSGGDSSEKGKIACYRVREVIKTIWNEIPHRMKDYITHPKANGYQSLHMAVDVSDGKHRKPMMEIHIRTTDMDSMTVDGSASHSLYKGGLTNPEEARRLKAIMMAAAELAALRLGDVPTSEMEGIGIDQKNRVFHLFDKNKDGRISSDELKEVMEELGANRDDATELMEFIDANSDGSLSSDEFDWFQKQVRLMRHLGDKDDRYRILLSDKLQITDSNDRG